VALTPTSVAHAAQIAAGVEGRRYGHRFELALTETLNQISNVDEIDLIESSSKVVFGLPAEKLLEFIFSNEKIDCSNISEIKGYWLGGLATGAGGSGVQLRDLKTGEIISGSSKSDVVVDIVQYDGRILRRGISVKSCSNEKPTNDQIFFTQAVAFCRHLRNLRKANFKLFNPMSWLLCMSRMKVTSQMENDLRRFCGDDGFRPSDELSMQDLQKRSGWPDRYFWEELETNEEWEFFFNRFQSRITHFLLAEGAYRDDPISPTYVLHQVRGYDDYSNVEMFISTIDNLVNMSTSYSKFSTREYSTRGARHLAPRFGFIQFQRGGQKQHPTQLQFNLQAGYFFK
jgi:hypothetical protein